MGSHFQHSPGIWATYPELSAVAIRTTGITPDAEITEAITTHTARAAHLLGSGTEADLPEIQAWRRTFARMNLKPTQYRCAAESLLRRFRKDGALPRIHPLVDLCNALSLAFAIPIAVLDQDRITGVLEVRPATGTETYRTLAGAAEHPAPGEVIFADAAGHAHARRWCNRQSGHSVVRPGTSSVLIVAEAVHASATADLAALSKTLTAELVNAWDVTPVAAQLSAANPRFDLG